MCHPGSVCTAMLSYLVFSLININWGQSCTDATWLTHLKTKHFSHMITIQAATILALWLGRWCMKPASLNYTIRKKKCNFPTFLRGGFPLFYRYSNFWVLQENREQFWNRFFAHCYQEHWQNVIYYKVHLSTLFPKSYRNFPCCVSFETGCIIL